MAAIAWHLVMLSVRFYLGFGIRPRLWQYLPVKLEDHLPMPDGNGNLCVQHLKCCKVSRNNA